MDVMPTDLSVELSIAILVCGIGRLPEFRPTQSTLLPSYVANYSGELIPEILVV